VNDNNKCYNYKTRTNKILERRKKDMRNKEIKKLLNSLCVGIVALGMINITACGSQTAASTTASVAVEDLTGNAGSLDTDSEGLTEDEAIADSIDDENSITDDDENTDSEAEEEVTIEENDTELVGASNPSSSKKYTVKKMKATKMYAKSTTNVRKGPSTSYKKLKTLKAGAKITVTGKVTYKNKKWYRIKLSDGTVGYVSCSLVSKTKTSSSNSSSGSSSSSKNNSSSSSSSSKNNNSSKNKDNGSSGGFGSGVTNGGTGNGSNKVDDGTWTGE
jgi:uncharacterized protein YgiM (DUF1202 family)